MTEYLCAYFAIAAVFAVIARMRRGKLASVVVGLTWGWWLSALIVLCIVVAVLGLFNVRFRIVQE